MRRIGARIELLRDGRGGVVVIEGEGGSGKTTLLSTALAMARELPILRATAHQIDRDRPFGVLRDALGGQFSMASGERTDGAALFAVVQEAVAEIEGRATTRPLILAIDDAQWADEPSLITLHHLWRRAAHIPLLLLIARRPVGRYSEADVLRDVASDPDVETVALPALDADGVADVAAAVCGSPPGRSLSAVLAKAGGNAFFVTELLAALRDEGSLRVVDGLIETDVVHVSPELRMIVLRRLGTLTPRTLSVLRTAAVLGSTFSMHDLAMSVDSASVDLVATLDEALAAGVIQADDDSLVFRHDLVHDALYGDVPQPIRDALHLHVARVLTDAGAAPTRAAPHFVQGATHGDAQAIDCLRRAAAEVGRVEPKTAQRWLVRAMELVDAASETHDAIVLELASVCMAVGDAARTETIATEALNRRQPPERRAALHRLLAAALDWQDRCLDASAVSALEAEADDQSDVERIRFAAESVETRIHVERSSAESTALAVLARAEQIGDRDAIDRVLSALYHAAMWRGDDESALVLARRLAATEPPEGGRAINGGMVGRALAHRGKVAEALESLRGDMSRLEERRDPRSMAIVLTELAALEIETGRWDEAVTGAEAAVDLALELGQAIRHDEAAVVLALVCIRRDQIERAQRLMGSLRADRRFVAALPRTLLAEIVEGPGAALSLLRVDWTLAVETERDSDLPTYGPLLVRLELAAGDRERARVVARVVDRIARKHPSPPALIAAIRCTNALAPSDDGLARAHRLAVEAGLTDTLAEVRVEIGNEEALRSAFAYYRDVGAERDTRRVTSLMRQRGWRVGSRGRRAGHQTGWEALSDTERSVVALVAEGLTNAEIGTRLFISGRTVERHLTHVYTKLGVSSRVELTRMATSRS